MLERRKNPRIEIRKSSQRIFNRPGLSAVRPRKVDVQGLQGPEHSAAGGNLWRRVGGWLLGAAAEAAEGAPRPSRIVRIVTNVDARLRVGILVITLAALLMSTNVIGSVAEVGGSISSRLRASVVIASHSVNVETLASLTKPNNTDWSGSEGHASPSNYKAALSRPCVRPEVYRSASDRSRFWWLLRDKHGRIMEEALNTYESETEARSAADGAATAHACDTRVTATRINARTATRINGRDGGHLVNAN